MRRFKNLSISLLILVFLLALASLVSAQSFIIGDANGDSVVDPIDSRLVANVAVLLNPVPPMGTLQFCRMDAKNDSRIDVLDALFIDQVILGIRSPLGICSSFLPTAPDNQAPVLFIHDPRDTGVYHSRNLLVNISAIDLNLDTVWYRINGGPIRYFNTSTVLMYDNFTPGLNTLIAYANDSFGNSVTQQITLRVAATRSTPQFIPNPSPDSPPSVSLNANPNNGTQPLSVVFNCSTVSGDAPFDYTFDAGDGSVAQMVSFGGTSFIFMHTYTTFGSFASSCNIIDNDGDSSIAYNIINVTSNNTAPNATIYSPTTGTSYLFGTNILFNGSGIDLEDGVLSGPSLVWASNLVGTIGSGQSFNLSSLPVGIHNITLTATDSLGAVGIASTVIQVFTNPTTNPNNDTTSPTLFILNPINGARYNTTSLLVDLLAIDPNLETVWYRINGGVRQTFVMTSRVTVQETFVTGLNTLTAYANDTYGNSVMQSIQFTVNLTAPPSVPNQTDLSPNMTLVANTTSGTEPMRVAFNCSTGSGNPNFNYTLDFGDGQRITAPASSSRIFGASHTYNTFGTYVARCTVTDTDGDFAFANLVITVNTNNSVPFFTNIAPPFNFTAFEDQEFFLDVNANDLDVGDILSFTSGSVLFAINSVTGIINVTPIQSDVGNHTFAVTVCDNRAAPNSCNMTSINVEVLGTNDAPLLDLTALNLSNVTMLEDSNLTIDLSTYLIDVNNPLISLTINCSTNQVDVTTMQNGTNLTLIAQNNYFGNVTVTCTVTDPSGLSDFDSFDVLVLAVNDAPVIVPSPTFNLTGMEDVLFEYDFNATDVDLGDILSFMLASPTIFLPINSSTGFVSFTPTQSDVGTHSMNLTVCDDSGAINNCTSSIFNLEILAVNDAPLLNLTALNATNVTMLEDSNLTIDLSTYLIDVNNPLMSLSVNCSTNQVDVTTMQNGSNLTLIAQNDFNGNVTVTCTVTDPSGSSSVDSFDVGVLPVNDAPIFVPTPAINLTVMEDVLFGYDFNASDVDFGDVLSFLLTSPTISIPINSSTGIVSFTPIMADVGNHTMDLTVCDNSGAVNNCTSSVFNLEILPTNDVPVLNLLALNGSNMSEDTSRIFSLSLYVNDSDDITSNLIFNCSSSVVDVLTLMGALQNQVNITATNNFVGTATITCTVTDPSGATDVDSFDVIITPVNDVPVIVPTPAINLTAMEDVLFVYDFNASDVDFGDVLSFSLTSPTISVAINNSTGIASFTPIMSQVGNHTMNLTVCDNSGAMNNCTSSIFTLQILPTNDGPIFDLLALNLTNVTMSEDMNTTIDLTPYITDLDDSIASLIINCSTSQASVGTAQNGTNLTLIATNDFVGNATVTCTVRDPSGSSSFDSFSVRVLPVNDAPVVDFGTFQTSVVFNRSVNVDLNPFVTDIDNNDSEIDFSCMSSDNNLTLNVNNATNMLNITHIGMNISAVAAITCTGFDSGSPRLSGFDSFNVNILNFPPFTIINSTINVTYYPLNSTSDVPGVDTSWITDSLVTGPAVDIDASNINRSTLTNGVSQNCTIIDSYVGAPCFGQLIDPSYIDEQSIITGTTPIINGRIINSTVTYSEFYNSNSTNSFINRSIITRCDIRNSIIEDANLTDCKIDGSTIDDSVVKNNSVINNSIIVNMSTINNGTIILSNITNSTVINTTLIEVKTNTAIIINGQICSGTIMDIWGNMYTANGTCVNLTDVINFRPTSLIGTISPLVRGSPTTFTAASTDPNIPGALNDTLNYTWIFGDGANATTNSTTFDHTYSSSGNYNVVLITTDRFGASSSASTTITIVDPSSTGGTGTGGVGGGSSGGGGSGGGGGGGRRTGATQHRIDLNGLGSGGIYYNVVEGDVFVVDDGVSEYILTFQQITRQNGMRTTIGQDAFPSSRLTAKGSTAYYDLEKSKEGGEYRYDLAIQIIDSLDKRGRVRFLGTNEPVIASEIPALERSLQRPTPIPSGSGDFIPSGTDTFIPTPETSGGVEIVPDDYVPSYAWVWWLLLILAIIIALIILFWTWLVDHIFRPFLRWLFIDVFGWRKDESGNVSAKSSAKSG